MGKADLDGGSPEPSPGDAPQGRVAGAAGWTMASRAVSQIVQFALFLAAVRFLTPADFGVYAMAQAGSLLLYTVGAAGWREFILGWRGEESAVNDTLGYAALSGYAMAIVGFAVAMVTGLVFDKVVLMVLFGLFAGCAMLAPLGVAYSGVLVRADRVRGMAIAEIAAETSGFVAGVAALFAGGGVLALGAAKLTQAVVQITLVILMARTGFRIRLASRHRDEILNVSGQILATRAVRFFTNNASTFIIGGLLGPASAGVFRAGERVVSSLAELVFEPLRYASWIIFRNAARDAPDPAAASQAVGRKAGLFFPMVLIIIVPVFVGISIVGDRVVAVLLGEAWRDAAIVVSLLAIAKLFVIPSIATEPMLAISGRIDRLPRVELVSAVAGVALLAMLAPFGLIGAAIAKILAGLIVLCASVLLQHRYAGADWARVLGAASPAYTAGAALVSAVLALRILLSDASLPQAGQLAGEIAFGACAYLGVVLLLKPNFVRGLARIA